MNRSRGVVGTLGVYAALIAMPVIAGLIGWASGVPSAALGAAIVGAALALRLGYLWLDMRERDR